MKFLILFFLFSCATAQKDAPLIQLDKDEIQASTEVISSPTHIVFTTKSSLPWVHEVSRIANCVINNEDFLKEVAAYPKFTYTDKVGADVAKALREHAPIEVRTYKTLNPRSKTNAYVLPSKRNEVYLNTRKYKNPTSRWVQTLVHESLHPEFSHGNNDIDKDTEEKLASVNYVVGSIAEKYAEKCL